MTPTRKEATDAFSCAIIVIANPKRKSRWPFAQPITTRFTFEESEHDRCRQERIVTMLADGTVADVTYEASPLRRQLTITFSGDPNYNPEEGVVKPELVALGKPIIFPLDEVDT